MIARIKQIWKDICLFFKKGCLVLKDGHLIDKIDYFRYVIAIFICFITVVIYANEYMLSIRGAISDTISYSSIVLGIIGLLIGLLISLKEDSIFFERAERFELDRDIYNKLLKRLRNAFMYNILLVLLSILYCFVIPAMPLFFKYTGLFIWFYLFIIVSWDVFYLIWIIVKICTFKNNSGNGRRTGS